MHHLIKCKKFYHYTYNMETQEFEAERKEQIFIKLSAEYWELYAQKVMQSLEKHGLPPINEICSQEMK